MLIIPILNSSYAYSIFPSPISQTDRRTDIYNHRLTLQLQNVRLYGEKQVTFINWEGILIQGEPIIGVVSLPVDK